MLEKDKAQKLRTDLTVEFGKTVELLADMYPRISRVKKEENLSENVFKTVIYSVLLNTLRELQYDSTKLTMREFHKKYVPNLPILYRGDFTCDEFRQIIDDSYLKSRDKSIAYKFFVERKNNNEVHDEMSNEISDKKTIDNNLEKINEALLYRACIYNKQTTN